MKLGKVNGIAVYLHWSVWMIILFHLVSSTLSGGLGEGMFAAAFVATALACVLAHEFGHAAAAARYSIRTTDISLYAFGGVARLQSLPKNPLQELIIAVAGPAVNVAIAAGLGLAMAFQIIPSGLMASGLAAENAPLTFADYVLSANIFLVVFNMLPAFPMDGGRVLRSLLAMGTSHLRATEIAARVGRFMALLFVAGSIYFPSFILLIIAIFVFLAGTAELMQVRLREHTHAGGQPLGTGAGSGGPSPFQMPGNGVRFVWQAGSPASAYGNTGPLPGRAPVDSMPADDHNVIDANDVRRIE